jgi:hypothetical protein
VRIEDSTSAAAHQRHVHACTTVRSRCRIVVNDLRMLVDRLRNGIDVVDIKARFGPRGIEDAPLPDPAAPPTRSATRPIYAVDPIGRVQHVADRLPQDPGPASIDNVPHVTNLGTLLDVLA